MKAHSVTINIKHDGPQSANDLVELLRNRLDGWPFHAEAEIAVEYDSDGDPGYQETLAGHRARMALLAERGA